MRCIYKQGENLNMFKETENFFDNAGQNGSTIDFKICKILRKSLVLKKLTLPSSYFRKKLKTMKSVCKKYLNFFWKIMNKSIVMLTKHRLCIIKLLHSISWYRGLWHCHSIWTSRSFHVHFTCRLVCHLLKKMS